MFPFPISLVSNNLSFVEEQHEPLLSFLDGLIDSAEKVLCEIGPDRKSARLKRKRNIPVLHPDLSDGSGGLPCGLSNGALDAFHLRQFGNHGLPYARHLACERPFLVVLGAQFAVRNRPL